jgi:hypothetical protein
MLLGENGDGKTTVLQALAIALMDPRQRRSLDVAEFLRRGAASGRIVVEFADTPGMVTVEFSAGDPTFRSAGGLSCIVAGYGAYRLSARNRRQPRYKVDEPPRVRSVLDPYAQLVASEPWLLNQPQQRFDSAARALKRLLIDEASVLHRRDGEVRLVRDDRSHPFGQLSAGYRSMIALAVDLMSYVLTHWETLEAAEGIVLIDEIGTHLHPRWQMRVVSAFRDAFPRLQFIASTHDPLCLRGLRKGEVVVLRRDDDGRIFTLRDLPSVEGLHVDQLLTSEHFGLASTLDPVLEEEFEEYYKLLSRRTLTPSGERRLAWLRDNLADYQQLGRNERERLTLEAADLALARMRRERDPDARAHMTGEARDRIAQIWSEAGF